MKIVTVVGARPQLINRICTDHVSTLLLVCTKNGYDERANEGLQSRRVLVGDPMYDALLNIVIDWI